jgi:hypothetical protein
MINQDDVQNVENKNILFKPKPMAMEQEIEMKAPEGIIVTNSFLNRSSMMTYSKIYIIINIVYAVSAQRQ